MAKYDVQIEPSPTVEPAVTPQSPTGKKWMLTRRWEQWMALLYAAVNLTAPMVGFASLTAQGAAITTTAVDTRRVRTGLYRVSYYARITRAATTNSSLTVTLGWTDGGVSCTIAGAAMTGNTTATVQSGSFLVRADVDTTFTYAAAYSSAGATSMQYALDVVVEALPLT